jgi:hypothetical protein
MTIDVGELPASVGVMVNGVYEELPIFGDALSAGDYEGHYAVPSENQDFGGWVAPWDGGSVGDVGSMYIATTITPGAKSIHAINLRPSPYTYNGYAEAYEAETGHHPPTGFLTPGIWAVLFALIIYLVFVAVVWYIDAQRQIAFHALDKASEFTQEPVEGDKSGCWTTVCKGNACSFLNTCTGKTLSGPEGETLIRSTEWTKVLTYGLIAAVVLGGIYVVVKLVPQNRGRRDYPDDLDRVR